MSTEAARFTISEATDQDLDGAADLFAGYLEFYGRRYDRRDLTAFLDERRRRAESLLLLAWVETNGTSSLAGMAHVYPTFSTLSLAPSWTLNDLYVLPSMRGSGVGRLLLRAVRDKARAAGAADVALETARDNRAARHLYETEGFKTDDGFIHYTLPLR